MKYDWQKAQKCIHQEWKSEFHLRWTIFLTLKSQKIYSKKSFSGFLSYLIVWYRNVFNFLEWATYNLDTSVDVRINRFISNNYVIYAVRIEPSVVQNIWYFEYTYHKKKMIKTIIKSIANGNIWRCERMYFGFDQFNYLDSMVAKMLMLFSAYNIIST